MPFILLQLINRLTLHHSQDLQATNLVCRGVVSLMSLASCTVPLVPWGARQPGRRLECLRHPWFRAAPSNLPRSGSASRSLRCGLKESRHPPSLAGLVSVLPPSTDGLGGGNRKDTCSADVPVPPPLECLYTREARCRSATNFTKSVPRLVGSGDLRISE